MAMKNKDTTSALMIKRQLLAGRLRIVCSLVRVIFCFILRPFFCSSRRSLPRKSLRDSNIFHLDAIWLEGCVFSFLYFPMIYYVQLLRNASSTYVQGCCKVHRVGSYDQESHSFVKLIIKRSLSTSEV